MFQNVRIYGVQCLDHAEAGTFWRDVAALTGGKRLKLDNLRSLVDLIMAICYREGGHGFLDVSHQRTVAIHVLQST